jgi:hypothetical protein
MQAFDGSGNRWRVDEVVAPHKLNFWKKVLARTIYNPRFPGHPPSRQFRALRHWRAPVPMPVPGLPARGPPPSMDRSVHSHASRRHGRGVTWPAGFNGTPPRHWVGVFLNGSAPGIPSRISPGKSALLPDATAAFTSTTKPEGFAVLCQLTRRVGLCIRFFFIGSSVSPSLPPPCRLPSRSWLQVMVSLYPCSGFPTGDFHPVYNAAPMLGAHKAFERTRT